MVILPAHAKVNLCLAVRGRRPDGFHDIDSVAVAVDWHDLAGVVVRPAPATSVRLTVAGDAGAVPAGEENLAVRAAHAVAALVGPLAATIWLDKRLPSRAGLGGGSADAAAVLRGVLEAAAAGALGRELERPSAASVAVATASLGSDVPMILAGGAQRMRGRGERLTALEVPPMWLVIAMAGSSDTAATYAALEPADVEAGHADDRVSRVAAALADGRAPAADDLGSALEAPACRAQPGLAQRLAALRSALPQARWHLTGSGGAAFALVRDWAAAAELAAAARAAGFSARAARTVAAAPPLRGVSG